MKRRRKVIIAVSRDTEVADLFIFLLPSLLRAGEQRMLHMAQGERGTDIRLLPHYGLPQKTHLDSSLQKVSLIGFLVGNLWVTTSLEN